MSSILFDALDIVIPSYFKIASSATEIAFLGPYPKSVDGSSDDN